MREISAHEPAVLISTQTSHLNSSPSGSLEEALKAFQHPNPDSHWALIPAVLEAELEVPRLSLRAQPPWHG